MGLGPSKTEAVIRWGKSHTSQIHLPRTGSGKWQVDKAEGSGVSRIYLGLIWDLATAAPP